MRAFRLLPAFLVAGLLACEPGTPTEVAAPDGPQFDITDAPDVAGIIVRGDRNPGYSWADPEAGMRVILGWDLQGVLDFCNSGIIDFDIVSFQDAVLPDGRVVRLDQGTEVETTVWPFTQFSCARFTTTTPLATGLADLVYTDNDFFVNGGNNTDAFGVMAHGFLERPSGASAVFSAEWRILNPPGPGAFHLSRQIILR